MQNQSSFSLHKFLNIIIHQLIFTNPLIWTRLKLVKKTTNKDIFRLGSSKKKKKEIIIYDLVLAFNKQESFIENENKRPKKIRTLSLIKILRALIRKCNVQGFFTKFMQIYAGLGFWFFATRMKSYQKVSFPLLISSSIIYHSLSLFIE